MQRVLFAGATRHLGKAVVREFKARGHFVRALARSPEKLSSLQGSFDELVTADRARRGPP